MTELATKEATSKRGMLIDSRRAPSHRRRDLWDKIRLRSNGLVDLVRDLNAVVEARSAA